MNVIKIFIVEKLAYNPDADVSVVCGNSDYQIKFKFDAEWNDFFTKTARFIYNDNIVDVVFEGDTVNVPVIANATQLKVGIFAGDLRTTTSATIPCIKSVRCEGGEVVDPTPSVYDQILDLINQIRATSPGATFIPYIIDGVLHWTNDQHLDNPPPVTVVGRTPVKGEDYWTPDEVEAMQGEINSIINERLGDAEVVVEEIIALQKSYLPTFEIESYDGTRTISFAPGMTWGEFFESEYNLDESGSQHIVEVGDWSVKCWNWNQVQDENYANSRANDKIKAQKYTAYYS